MSSDKSLPSRIKTEGAKQCAANLKQKARIGAEPRRTIRSIKNRIPFFGKILKRNYILEITLENLSEVLNYMLNADNGK